MRTSRVGSYAVVNPAKQRRRLAAKLVLEGLEDRILLSPTQLAVLQQPPPIVGIGQAFDVKVAAEDSTGDIDTSFTGSVTIGIAGGSGFVGNTITASAVAGVADFPNLTYGSAEQGDDLLAYSAAVSPSYYTYSNSFTVAFTPAQIRTAFGINQLTGDGKGQTIAIVDPYNDPNIYSDTDTFDGQFGLTPSSGATLYQQYGAASSFLTVCDQNGNIINPSTTTEPPDDADSATEESLDVEWAHAIAPGAKIVLIECNLAGSSIVDEYALFTAGVGVADNLASGSLTIPGVSPVSVVSMSLSVPEIPSETSYDYLFTQPGVTYLAATGDDGANEVGYPAYSPNVIAVGGTSLTLDSNDNYVSETGWSDGGGGLSQYETEPGYQESVQTSGQRSIPDVALVADPATGAAIVDSYSAGGEGPWAAVGGTSWATPSWAGLIALANQGRVAAGKTLLDATGPTQTLAALYSLPSTDFHDITTGNNGYPAGPGYDLITGRGTPVANLLVPDLVQFVAESSVAISSSANPSVTGQPVIFTATVTSATPGAGTPAGSVQFQVDGQDLGSPVVLNASGVASVTDSDLTTGNYQVTAAYTNSDGNFSGSSGTLAGGQQVDASALPDLTPYTPSGWSGPLVVTTQIGTTTDASVITTSDTVYIDWAIINQGTAATNATFHTELLLDGQQVATWATNPPLGAGDTTTVTDYSLGQLAAGQHTVEIIANYLNEVTESDPNNNTSSYTFTVTGQALPDLAPFTPLDWSGPLVVTTQRGSTTTASSITSNNAVYIDWAFINQGTAATAATFHTELLLDGQQITTWYTSPPLDVNWYTYIENYDLGPLTAGQHTITVVANYLDEVPESNTTNNTETYTFTVAAPLPDLAPYTPSGWSGPLVISTQAGLPVTAGTITTADTVYVNWAFSNQGTAPTTVTFHTELLLDGNQVTAWETDPPMFVGDYISVADYSLGQLSAGQHTVTVITNYLDEVEESNRANDTITYTFAVDEAPVFTSQDKATFTIGTAGSFTVTAAGLPAPRLSEATTDTLPSGITFNPATGVLGGTPAAGSQGTYVLHFTAANGVGSNATQTFTLTVNAPAAPTISGNVFQDFNLNGTQDSGEPGIAGVTLYLDLNNSGVLAAGDPTAITDSNGDYSLTAPGPGTYTLREVLYGGVLLNAPASGSDQITVTAGQHVTGEDFADVPTSITVPLTLPPSSAFPKQGTPDADFVEAVYRAVLDRNADPTGLAIWTSALQNGSLTRLAVVQGIRNSPEHFQDEVTDFYFTILDRAPDPAGLNAWVQTLQDGVPEEQVAADFLNSPEYLSKGDRYFVDHMYEALLGRTYDPAGEAAWLNLLGDDSSGTATHPASLTHAQVIQDFIYSQESLTRLVEGYYQVFLQRPADATGLSDWLALLGQGQPFSTIGEQFLASDEFYDRAAAEG
jgi:Bacterial Ig-like domain (group 3)/SdrD B-like domain/Domain of unknown function (DUF4214)/Putative Ig domain/CARDB